MNHLSFFLHTQTQDVNHVTPKSSVNASQFVMCSPWRTFIMEKQAEKYAQMSCVFAMWAKVGHILYIHIPTGGWAVATWWWFCRPDSLMQPLHQSFVPEFVLIWRFLFKFRGDKIMPAVTSCMSLEQPVEVTSHVRCSECAAVQTWNFFFAPGTPPNRKMTAVAERWGCDSCRQIDLAQWIREPTVHESGAAPLCLTRCQRLDNCFALKLVHQR